MKNLIMYKQGENSFVRWIQKRIRHNLNFLAIAEGQTGIGKSWFLLSLAYKIDQEFESRQVAFSFKQVMEIINSDWLDKKKYKVVIFDEAQTDIGNRQWQSLTNKLMNYLLSTFRHRNIILLFTSPYSDFIDSQSKKLLHVLFEVKSHSRKTNLTTIRPKILQYNSSLKKFYQHSLFVIKGKGVHKLSVIKLSKPPEHLIKPYEIAKREFTDKLNRDIMQELTALENNKQSISITKPLTEKQQAIYDLKLQGLKGYEIAEKVGVVPSLISKQLELIQKKGYTLENKEMEANHKN